MWQLEYVQQHDLYEKILRFSVTFPKLLSLLSKRILLLFARGSRSKMEFCRCLARKQKCADLCCWRWHMREKSESNRQRIDRHFHQTASHNTLFSFRIICFCSGALCISKAKIYLGKSRCNGRQQWNWQFMFASLICNHHATKNTNQIIHCTLWVVQWFIITRLCNKHPNTFGCCMQRLLERHTTYMHSRR